MHRNTQSSYVPVQASTNQKPRRKGRGGLIALSVVSGAVAIAAIVAIVVIMWPYISGYSSAHSGSDFRTEATDTVQAEETSASPIDWEGLLAANPDVQGWVYVPGTKIDYPLVQAFDSDPDFYLDHDLNRQPSCYGCPYLDASDRETGGINSPLVIAYGHNLITGDMFTDFQRYSNYAYAAEHRRIVIYTPDGYRELDVVAADVVDANVETIETGFLTAEEMREYAGAQIAQSDVVLGDVGEANQVFCFVTCSYQTSNARTIVYAVPAVEM